MKRFLSMFLAAIVLAVLAACDAEGTVTANTNPSGNPDKGCTLSWVTGTGDEHSKEFSAQTCKQCQVGAAFPACWRQGGVDNRKPEETAKQGEPIILRVVASSTKRGFSITIVVVDAKGKERKPDVWNEATQEKELTFPAFTNDRSISVTVIATPRGATVSCQILGPARAHWMEPNIGNGRITCRSEIRSRL